MYNYSHIVVVEWWYKFGQWKECTKDLTHSKPIRSAAPDESKG